MNRNILFSVQDIGVGGSIKENIEVVLKEKFTNVLYIKDEYKGKDQTIKYKILRETLKKVSEKNFFKKVFREYENKIKRNEAKKYKNIDYFLIISGGKFSIEFFEILRKNNKNIKIILFLWDKLENSFWKDKLNNFDYIFSYDRLESLKNNFIFRPTFFIDKCLENIPIKKEYDLYYIGGLKENKRYEYLSRLKKYLLKNNISINFKLYAGKKTIKKLSNNIDYDIIINKKIDYIENLELLKKSRVILDIKYKDQDGLSLRIYEALATGAKIITDSKDIENYNFYNEENIKIIERIEDIEKIEINFFKTDVIRIDETIKKQYSVKNFIEDIFKIVCIKD